jgi:amidohydrolase
MDIKTFNELKPRLVELRRRFHQIPELGFEEIETSKLIRAELDELGIEYQAGIGGTGILAEIGGKNRHPLILLRFDMDGLPIQEMNEVDYKSTHQGRMHACGHDSHVATGLVLAKLLMENKGTLKGSVEIFFQPAEENFGGAEALLKSGLLDSDLPDSAMAFHVWNERPLGWVGVTPGPVMAGDDIFQIKLTGVGGHGAIPNKTIDPIVAGANIVQALQTIVSRNVDPLKPAVLSVTKFTAGETYNVIPEKAELLGTLRYFDPEIHDVLIKQLNVIVQDCAKAYGCKVDIKITRLTPAVNNDPQTTKIIADVVKDSGLQVEIDTGFRTMGSEDMALILQKIAGTYFFVGSANEKKGKIFGHHHPQFDIDEDALPIALQILYSSTLELLNHKKE